MSPELIAILSAVCGIIGGVLLKVVDKKLTKKDTEFEHDIEQGKEFRTQIKELQERQNYLEEQLTEWKDKYYKLVEEMTQVKTERDQMRIDVKVLQNEVMSLRKQICEKPSGGKK